VDILLLLIPLSVGIVFLAAWAFRWSLDNDQFEDLERHGRSVLHEDPDHPD
jgi:cbb3-type cytochrome oxidase maturation protein